MLGVADKVLVRRKYNYKRMVHTWLHAQLRSPLRRTRYDNEYEAREVSRLANAEHQHLYYLGRLRGRTGSHGLDPRRLLDLGHSNPLQGTSFSFDAELLDESRFL